MIGNLFNIVDITIFKLTFTKDCKQVLREKVASSEKKSESDIRLGDTF